MRDAVSGMLNKRRYSRREIKRPTKVLHLDRSMVNKGFLSSDYLLTSQILQLQIFKSIQVITERLYCKVYME